MKMKKIDLLPREGYTESLTNKINELVEAVNLLLEAVNILMDERENDGQRRS